MIKKVWAKFNGMDIDCVCDEHHRKCVADSGCREYVAKFIEIDREQQAEEAIKHLEMEATELSRTIKKFESEVSKSIKKFKRI